MHASRLKRFQINIFGYFIVKRYYIVLLISNIMKYAEDQATIANSEKHLQKLWIQ